MGIAGLLVTAFVIGLSGAMGPGSLLVAVITETMRHGFWAGPVAIAGHAAVEIIVVALLSLGFGTFLAYDTVLGAVGLLGGLTLLYFGYGTWRSAGTATLDFDLQNLNVSNITKANVHSTRDNKRGSPGFGGGMHTAALGIAASVSNPYWIIWWATVGATYVAAGTKHGILGPITFYVGHIAADFAWYTLVSWACATGKKFINDKVYQAILYTCSAFVFLFGAYFLQLGVRLVFKL